MLKFWTVLFFIIAWSWFIYCTTQPWGGEVLLINIFSVVAASWSAYTAFTDDL